MNPCAGIDSPSLISMLVGGVAFETPATFAVAGDVPEEMVFDLYPNRQATRQTRYSLKSRFLLNFEGSVGGLMPGAAVELRGIKIGEVEDVHLEFESSTGGIRVPVVISIEPERLGLTEEMGAADGSQYIYDFVANGMRAQLKTANFLTGSKAIDFVFVEGAEPAEILVGNRYPELPTYGGGFDALTARVTRIVDRVDKLPIDSIGKNLDQVLASLKGTLGEVETLAGAANEELIPSLTKTLKNLEGTLESADSMLAPGSPIPREIERLLVDFAEAARSIRLLAERLEEHPEELLRGKSE